MSKFLNPDENPILPGIDGDAVAIEEVVGGGVEEVKEIEETEETRPQQGDVPEVKLKFANPDDGLDEKCSVCGDHGCPQCGGGGK